MKNNPLYNDKNRNHDRFDFLMTLTSMTIMITMFLLISFFAKSSGQMILYMKASGTLLLIDIIILYKIFKRKIPMLSLLLSAYLLIIFADKLVKAIGKALLRF